MAMAAWLIRRGQLSLWAWGPGMSAYAIVLVGGGLVVIDMIQAEAAPPSTSSVLWTFAVIGAGGLLYGLVFRAVLGWLIRRKHRMVE
jgi:hypothetical protein